MDLEIVPAKSAAEAGWLAERMERSWSRGDGANYAAAIIPSGFAAYARIFHPAGAPGGGHELSWAEVARRYGREPHSEMQWQAITRPAVAKGEPPVLHEPATGTLPEGQARALVKILRRHTRTPNNCWFAIWEGWAGLGSEKQWAGAARLHLPDRAYLLLRGPVEAAATSFVPFHHQSPNLWWPQDRAWCVATEIDMMWTYVGGSNACIAEILASPRLEALQATLDDRADIHGDRINR